MPTPSESLRSKVHSFLHQNRVVTPSLFFSLENLEGFCRTQIPRNQNGNYYLYGSWEVQKQVSVCLPEAQLTSYTSTLSKTISSEGFGDWEGLEGVKPVTLGSLEFKGEVHKDYDAYAQPESVRETLVLRLQRPLSKTFAPRKIVLTAYYRGDKDEIIVPLLMRRHDFRKCPFFRWWLPIPSDTTLIPAEMYLAQEQKSSAERAQ